MRREVLSQVLEAMLKCLGSVLNAARISTKHMPRAKQTETNLPAHSFLNYNCHGFFCEAACFKVLAITACSQLIFCELFCLKEQGPRADVEHK